MEDMKFDLGWEVRLIANHLRRHAMLQSPLYWGLDGSPYGDDEYEIMPDGFLQAYRNNRVMSGRVVGCLLHLAEHRSVYSTDDARELAIALTSVYGEIREKHMEASFAESTGETTEDESIEIIRDAWQRADELAYFTLKTSLAAIEFEEGWASGEKARSSGSVSEETDDPFYTANYIKAAWGMTDNAIRSYAKRGKIRKRHKGKGVEFSGIDIARVSPSSPPPEFLHKYSAQINKK